MPYLGASFDDATQAALAEAADRFAASSPFERDQTRPFHIPLIGGLHVYTRDEISNAVEAGSQPASDAIEVDRAAFSSRESKALDLFRWLIDKAI